MKETQILELMFEVAVGYLKHGLYTMHLGRC